MSSCSEPQIAQLERYHHLVLDNVARPHPRARRCNEYQEGRITIIGACQHPETWSAHCNLGGGAADVGNGIVPTKTATIVIVVVVGVIIVVIVIVVVVVVVVVINIPLLSQMRKDAAHVSKQLA